MRHSIFSLFFMGASSALPFLQALAPRATYSVVPIDGSEGEGNGAPATTAPKPMTTTVTYISVSIHPAPVTTEIITSIIPIAGSSSLTTTPNTSSSSSCASPSPTSSPHSTSSHDSLTSTLISVHMPPSSLSQVDSHTATSLSTPIVTPTSPVFTSTGALPTNYGFHNGTAPLHFQSIA